jgi:signal transduction histidine kinase
MVTNSAFPTIGEDGQVKGVIAVSQDVTRRFQLERQHSYMARASKALMESLTTNDIARAIVDIAVPELADLCVLYLLDEKGRLEPAASRAKDGPSKDDFENSAYAYPLDPEAELGIYNVLNKNTYRYYPEVPDELLYSYTKDKTWVAKLRQIMKSYIAVRLASRGKPLGVLVMVFTEGHRRYDDSYLATARDLATVASLAIENVKNRQNLEREKGVREEMLAIVSHDLKSPLAAVAASAEFLTRISQGPQEQVKAHLVARSSKTIKNAELRMEHLINELLDASKIESGVFDVKPSESDLHGLFDQACAIFEPLAEQKGIELEVVVEPDLPKLKLDRERILQVVSNLIGNSLKFCPNGGRVIVNVRQRSNEWIEVAVSDNGPGIDGKAQPHLFDRYWQAQKGSRAGAGLGLYISKGIVEAHHGRIFVDSEPGRGSTFTFTIPTSFEVQAQA